MDTFPFPAFSRRSSRFEKIQSATADFTKGRTWPAQTKSETGPKFIWEKVTCSYSEVFRLYEVPP